MESKIANKVYELNLFSTITILYSKVAIAVSLH